MVVNFEDYALYDPGVKGVWRDLSRREARAAFDRLMDEKCRRIKELKSLLVACGLEIDTSDSSLAALNGWLVSNVQVSSDLPDRLTPEWYSVSTDVGLYLGEVLIERAPNLHWHFFVGSRRDESYQEPVVTGFRDTPDPSYYVNLAFRVVGLGHRVIHGLPTPVDFFEHLISDNVKLNSMTAREIRERFESPFMED